MRRPIVVIFLSILLLMFIPVVGIMLIINDKGGTSDMEIPNKTGLNCMLTEVNPGATGAFHYYVYIMDKNEKKDDKNLFLSLQGAVKRIQPGDIKFKINSNIIEMQVPRVNNPIIIRDKIIFNGITYELHVVYY